MRIYELCSEIIGSFVDQQFLDPEDDRVLNEMALQPTLVDDMRPGSD